MEKFELLYNRHTPYAILKRHINDNDYLRLNKIFEKYGFDSKDCVSQYISYCKNTSYPNMLEWFVDYLTHVCGLRHNEIYSDTDGSMYKYVQNLITDAFTLATEKMEFDNALRFNREFGVSSGIDMSTVDFKAISNILNSNKTIIIDGFLYQDRPTRLTYNIEDKTVMTKLDYIDSNGKFYHTKFKITFDSDFDNTSVHLRPITIIAEVESRDEFKKLFGRKPDIMGNLEAYMTLQEEEFFDIKDKPFAWQLCFYMYLNLICVLNDYVFCLSNQYTTIEERTARIEQCARTSVLKFEGDEYVYDKMSNLLEHHIVNYTEPKGTHASPRPHPVEGHPRHYKNGKVIWVRPYNKPCPNYQGADSSVVHITTDDLGKKKKTKKSKSRYNEQVTSAIHRGKNSCMISIGGNKDD